MAAERLNPLVLFGISHFLRLLERPLEPGGNGTIEPRVAHGLDPRCGRAFVTQEDVDHPVGASGLRSNKRPVPVRTVVAALSAISRDRPKASA